MTELGDLPEFDQSLPMVLTRALDAARQAFRPALHAAGLTEAQWRVLRALADVDDATVSEVAGRCALQLPSMTRIVRRFVEDGFIERSVDPADQRRTRLSITADGLAVIRRVSPAIVAAYADIERRLGVSGLDAVTAALDELVRELSTDARRSA